MGAAQSRETLIWTLVVPTIVAAVSCGFCIVYRYSFNQPIVGTYSNPPRSAAWNRPLGTDRIEDDIETPGGKLNNSWGYKQKRSSPYRLQLSGRVQTVTD